LCLGWICPTQFIFILLSVISLTPTYQLAIIDGRTIKAVYRSSTARNAASMANRYKYFNKSQVPKQRFACELCLPVIGRSSLVLVKLLSANHQCRLIEKVMV
jgi:hypothetical protein